jgi:hypothetical protein
MIHQLQPKPKKTSVGVYLNEKTYNIINELADKAGVSFNNAANQVIDLGLQQINLEGVRANEEK